MASSQTSTQSPSQILTKTIDQKQQNNQSKSLVQSSGTNNTSQKDISKTSLFEIDNKYLQNSNLSNNIKIENFSKNENISTSGDDSIKKILEHIRRENIEPMHRNNFTQDSQWEYIEEEEKFDEGGQGYFMENDFHVDEDSICRIQDLQQLLDNINLNMHKFSFDKINSDDIKQQVTGDKYNMQSKKEVSCKKSIELEFPNKNNMRECKNNFESKNIHLVDNVMETDNNVSQQETDNDISRKESDNNVSEKESENFVSKKVSVMKQDEIGKTERDNEKAVPSVNENVMRESDVSNSSDSQPSFLLIPSF